LAGKEPPSQPPGTLRAPGPLPAPPSRCTSTTCRRAPRRPPRGPSPALPARASPGPARARACGRQSCLAAAGGRRANSGPATLRRGAPPALSPPIAQGDPYAAPSRLRVRVPAGTAGPPPALLQGGPARAVALRDWLARRFAAVANTATRQARRRAPDWALAPPSPRSRARCVVACHRVPACPGRGPSPLRPHSLACATRPLAAQPGSSPSAAGHPCLTPSFPLSTQNQAGWHGAKGGDVHVDAPGAFGCHAPSTMDGPPLPARPDPTRRPP
jgi:hypothetical protein